MSESKDEMLARHEKEKKDLSSRITGMKKQASKKTRKRVMKRARELEDELARKQAEEVAEMSQDKEVGKEEDSGDGDEVTPEMLLAQLELEEKQKKEELAKLEASKPKEQQKSHKKHRNRRREKIEKRNKQMKEQQEKAREEAAKMPSKHEIEDKNIKELCMAQDLVEHEITPDGHCLFASVSDQLKLRQQIDASVSELRHTAAKYIREHPDTFEPFLFDEKTMTMRNIKDYTEQLENTAMWGGDLEILALAQAYNCPISVMMSGRPALKMNEDGQQPELKLVYYEHRLGLGEHYNSLRDKGDADEEEQNDGFQSVSEN